MRSDRQQRANSVPVTVLTGFLGSGKTTVLNHLLRNPDLADTAVIVNEFGEVGLDHLLIGQAIENAVLLRNGCICCTVRGDILDTVGELLRKRESGELPWFRRIAIETTGLADPAPVAQTLTTGELPVHLDGIATTADAVHIHAHLREQAEARHQIAFADRILLTKTDLAPAEPAEAALRRYNPRAAIRVVRCGSVAPSDVFGLGPEDRPADWLGHGHHHHDTAGIGSVVLRTDTPVAWAGLELWLNSLLSLHGADILRVKGLVRITGHPDPIVLQAVHHVPHAPTRLSADAARAWDHTGCEIVVIHRGLPDAGLRAGFAAAVGGIPFPV